MKYKTLTSTLVLSLMLIGAKAFAMDARENESSFHTQRSAGKPKSVLDENDYECIAAIKERLENGASKEELKEALTHLFVTMVPKSGDRKQATLYVKELTEVLEAQLEEIKKKRQEENKQAQEEVEQLRCDESTQTDLEISMELLNCSIGPGHSQNTNNSGDEVENESLFTTTTVFSYLNPRAWKFPWLSSVRDLSEDDFHHLIGNIEYDGVYIAALDNSNNNSFVTDAGK